MSAERKIKLIFSVIMVGIVLVAEFILWPRTITKSGNVVDLTGLNSGQKLVLSAPATVSAASSGFFLLRKEMGEVIAGVPADRPLGWPDNTYFTIKAAADKGEWIIQDGDNISMHLIGVDGAVLTVDQLPDESKKLLLVLFLPMFGLILFLAVMV